MTAATILDAQPNRFLREPERCLTSYLHEAALRCPNKVGVIFEDRRFSYCEIDLEAQCLARKLIASGVGSGDRIALHMHNGSDLAIGYFACFYAGAVAVPVNTGMKAREIEYVLAHSGASIYLGQPELFREIQDIQARFAGIRHFIADCREFEIPSDCSAARSFPRIEVDRPAAILYTSGTTAWPKGVVHTHRTLLHAARGLGVQEREIVTIVTPMVHAAAFMMLLASVDATATALIAARFEPDAALDAIARYRGTYLLAMPVMYRALIAAQRTSARDVRSVERYLATGDTVPSTLKCEFAECFGHPLYELFGTTEAGLVAANWSSAASHLGSFGRAVPGVEIALADESDDAASGGRVGEMIVRSAATMVGYWKDEGATKKALENGWFRTGDVVRQDFDGYLWFQGRKKEIIVRGGSSVSPQEVEAVLHQHAGVREAGVVGVPDATWGERVVAFVSRWSNQSVSADELIAFVATRLAAYKIPERIVFLEVLPKGDTGKIQRRALRLALTGPDLGEQIDKRSVVLSGRSANICRARLSTAETNCAHGGQPSDGILRAAYLQNIRDVT
jgi:long-chain acyl-CoA synthetase